MVLCETLTKYRALLYGPDEALQAYAAEVIPNTGPSLNMEDQSPTNHSAQNSRPEPAPEISGRHTTHPKPANTEPPEVSLPSNEAKTEEPPAFGVFASMGRTLDNLFRQKKKGR
jgi:hypothetical protein